MYVDYAAKGNCWNLWDSYGEICVGCGCCSKDPIERTKNRLRVLEERVEYWKDFQRKSDLEDFQLENIRKDLHGLKKQIAYYRKRLEAKNGRNNTNAG